MNNRKETVALGGRDKILFTDLPDRVMQTLADAFRIDVNLVDKGGVLEYITIDWNETTATPFTSLKRIYTKFNPVLVMLLSNEDSAPCHYALIDLETGNLVSAISSDMGEILESALKILPGIRDHFIRYSMAVN